MRKFSHIEEFKLNEWLDGTLSAADQKEIEAHLDKSPECRAKATALQHLFAELDATAEEGLLELSPSADLASNIMAAIAARSPKQEFISRQTLLQTLLMQSIGALGFLVFSGSLLRDVTVRWLEGWMPLLWQMQPSTIWSTWRDQLAQAVLDNWIVVQQWVTSWATLIQPPTVPNISLTLWLSLLLVSCVIWLAVTRWLVFKEG